MGDSGEHNPARPICNVLKKLLWLSVRVGLLVNTWLNYSLHITTGLENKNICRGIQKYGIISKLQICCVRDNNQDFGNFEESLVQDILLDTKT